MYVAELSPPAIRGRLVGIYEISVQTGTCIGFWICYGVEGNMAKTSAQWVTPFAIQLIPGGLLVIGMFFVPESPRYACPLRPKGSSSADKIGTGGLLGINRMVLLPRRLPCCETALKIIRTCKKSFRISWRPWKMRRIAEPTAISGPSSLRPATASALSWVFSSSSSCNLRDRMQSSECSFTLLVGPDADRASYYSPRIFKSVGLTGSSTKLYATGIYGIVRLVCVIIAMNFVVDRFGRRNMLMGGAAVMLVAMWFIGAYIKVAGPTEGSALTAGGYAAVTFIYIFAVGFCFSYAGIPWIYCAEIFPLRIRALGIAICTAVHWLFNFVIARAVPYMISNIGYGTYFFFASCITLSIPFVYFCLPETKGLSLEEIDVIFGAAAPPLTAEVMLEEGEKVLDYPKAAHVEKSIE